MSTMNITPIELDQIQNSIVKDILKIFLLKLYLSYHIICNGDFI